jgi:hypothetical protein
MVKCSICGEKKSKDEMVGDICQECASSIVKEDDFDVGMDDFS